MEKLKLQTTNQVDENVRRIGELFPNCLTEALDENGRPQVVVDFDQLRQELSQSVVEGPEERYQFTWPDKRNAIRLANAPTTDTLRPCREESVDFDNTQNLYIEGDNLQVLKLLREDYLGKVKIIYIDPPYNTGNDFVYNDKYSQKAEDYIHNSGQEDEDGNRLVTNTESNGRFHTDWLNMIYPRLKVAKDLLDDDGVIFISIDDNEAGNLKKVCDEVFEASNFVSQLVWEKKKKGSFLSGSITNIKEYVLVYCRNIHEFQGLIGEINKETETYPCVNAVNKREIRVIPAGIESKYKEKNFTLPKGSEISDTTMSLLLHSDLVIKDGVLAEELIIEGNWRYAQDAMKQYADNKEIYITRDLYLRRIVKDARNKTLKDLLPRVGEDDNSQYNSPIDLNNLFTSGWGSNEDADEELRLLMGTQKLLDYPKPVRLIYKLLASYRQKDIIVLDFFSGSATTAQAVIQLNADDGGNRKFILVQLPEITYEGKTETYKDEEGKEQKRFVMDEKTGYPIVAKDSEARKAGYYTIPQIGKERIRRAGKKILDERKAQQNDMFSGDLTTLDIGFRVLKLDSSNMEDVFYTPEQFTEGYLFDNNVKPDRTSEDLLFQSMIDLGIELSSKIERKSIAGKEVWSVANGYMMACFDSEVNESAITEIARQKPYFFVMRDSSLANDQVADNFEQIWELYSKDTERRIL